MFHIKYACSSYIMVFNEVLYFKRNRSVAPARGGKGGRLPPNVEKDGPRNSSKFDEKIGRGVRIHLRCEKIINTKYLVTVLFCTVFLLRGCYSELRNQRSTAFYCKN